MYGYSRILLTGGAGFIGSHILDRFLQKDVEVVVLDNLCGGRLENIQQHMGEKNFRFVKGDVKDAYIVKGLIKDVDAVIHQAALVSVPESIKNPVLTNDVNVNGTLNVLKASVDSDVSRFIYASSSAVYGNAKSLPIKENYPLRPASPYGVSKLSAENYANVFFEVFGLKTVCLRYFNVYGPRQVHNDYSGVITQFISKLEKNLPLVIFGDGEQTRDFVHVQDVAEATILALKKGIAGETFNIATGVATTINQLASTLLQVTNKTRTKLVHSEPRKGDIRDSVADISKAREKLHFNPSISLTKGLKALAKNMTH
jgi:UDP-glucose 4-epimerase